MDKIIITAALTGNVPTRKVNPNVPVTPQDIAADVRRCADAGASVFHIHARDAEEKPTLEASAYQAIVRAVKEAAPEVIIQLSTGARAGRDWAARAEPIRLLPEMGSFTTGSSNMPGLVYENSPQFLDFLAGVFKETGVKPEIEVFEAGMISNALHLQRKGHLSPPLHFNFVLGVPGAMGASVRNLAYLADSLPPGSTWTATGIGRAQIPMGMTALVMGGQVRVGLEDSLFYPDGSLADNPGLVAKMVHLAREVGREPATPDEARDLLFLNREYQDRILGG